jgi:hypothetical protein
MTPKYYNLTEANALIPMVTVELQALQQLKTDYHHKYYELKILKAKQDNHDDKIFNLECQLEFMQVEADLHMNNLESKGIQLKDIDHGLIDFPAIHEGEEVLLCWRQGEEQIRYYHGVDGGFSGRKLIKPGDF